MDLMNLGFMKMFCAFLPAYLDKEYEFIIRYDLYSQRQMRFLKTENKDICAEIYTSFYEIKDCPLFKRVWENNTSDMFFDKVEWEKCISELKTIAEAGQWKAQVVKVAEAANDIVKIDTMINELNLGFALQTSITERNDDNTAKAFKTEIVSTIAFYVDDREEYLFHIFSTLYMLDKASFAKKFNDSIDDSTKADLMEEVLIGRNMQIRDYLGV